MILKIPAGPLDFVTARERPYLLGRRDVVISRLDGVKLVEAMVRPK